MLSICKYVDYYLEKSDFSAEMSVIFLEMSDIFSEKSDFFFHNLLLQQMGATIVNDF